MNRNRPASMLTKREEAVLRIAPGLVQEVVSAAGKIDRQRAYLDSRKGQRAMTDRDRLLQLLRGNKDGLTRTELSYRLSMPDRAVRKLIEEAVAESDWPIYADRDGGGEARYRILRSHETDLCNRANAEDRSRAMSLLAKAKGRREAFARRYQAGSLFLDQVEEMDAA